MDTVDATTELIDRIIGDYKGEIEGGNEYIGHLNTKWSVIYKFNSIFYSLLTIQSCLLLLGVKMLETTYYSTHYSLLTTCLESRYWRLFTTYCSVSNCHRVTAMAFHKKPGF